MSGRAEQSDAEWLRPKCTCGADCHAQAERLTAKLNRIGSLVADYEDSHSHGRGLCADIKAVLRG